MLYLVYGIKGIIRIIMFTILVVTEGGSYSVVKLNKKLAKSGKKSLPCIVIN